MKTRIYIVIFSLLLLAGCNNSVTDTSGPAHRKATNIPETPFVLEGDYTPDTGVLYKVIVDDDTCFVTIDSLSDEAMYGVYYQVVPGSDCVEKKVFSKDRHWKEQRSDAIVYIYQAPEYHQIVSNIYRKPIYNVSVKPNVEYGEALGYWVSMPNTDDESYLQILSEGIKNSLVRTTQSLTMDIYLPDSNTNKRPLLLLLHGGGFYVGDKQDSAISAWCRHFASTGYVAVSANYRLGYLPAKSEIARTGYMALQDAHAAMRYLVEQADVYNIDTSLLFVGGASAGSITALNLAFMREKDRPKAVYNNKWRDLGAIESSGNSSKATFQIKAVANMWGALTNLNMLKNSKTDIVSFHGDADQVVPYDSGYPFSDVSEKLGQRLFDRMYGSYQIDKRARELGLRSILYTFPGQGHSLHHYSDGKWNQKNFEMIRDRMTEFFYEEIAGPAIKIETDRNDNRHYLIADEGASDVSWDVEGGFIMRMESNEIWVVWRDDAKQHTLRVSGHNPKGFGFEDKMNIDMDNNQNKK